MENVTNETVAVDRYLKNKTAVMLHVREAARIFFMSPYRHWNEGTLLDRAANAQSLAEYLQRYVHILLGPIHDPGHDAEAMLRLALLDYSLARVDWQHIAEQWRQTTKAECEIHGTGL